MLFPGHVSKNELILTRPQIIFKSSPPYFTFLTLKYRPRINAVEAPECRPLFPCPMRHYSDSLFSLQHSRFLLCLFKNCFPTLHSLRVFRDSSPVLDKLLLLVLGLFSEGNPCARFQENESSITFVESSNLNPLQTTYPRHIVS